MLDGQWDIRLPLSPQELEVTFTNGVSTTPSWQSKLGLEANEKDRWATEVVVEVSDEVSSLVRLLFYFTVARVIFADHIDDHVARSIYRRTIYFRRAMRHGEFSFTSSNRRGGRHQLGSVVPLHGPESIWSTR